MEKDAAEHSAMLGFSGLRYNAKNQPGPLHRFIYVGFESVALSNMGFVNGGFADDVWLTNGSGGAFHPHIESFSIEHVASANRVNPRRATLSFSGLAQNIRIHDADIYNLHAEQDDDWRNAPRRDPVFSKSIWDLAQIKAEQMGFAMKRKVMTLKANALEATVGFAVHYCGGVIGASTLNVGAEQDSRFIELDEMNFDRVTWQLHADQAGAVRGLQPRSSTEESCIASFTNNTFRVIGTPASGQLVGSEHLAIKKVMLTFRGCSYEPSFGSLAGTAIARVNAIGTWIFSQIDLHGLNPNQALPKSPDPAVIRVVV